MLTSRNTRLAAAAGILALGLLIASLPGSPEVAPRVKAAPNAPNVVVILSDDANFQDMQVMRKTKRLLTRHGTKFSRYFATFPLCCPARASLLTGQYSHNHGVFSNLPPNGGFPGFDDEGSLPQALQATGYRTAWIGKYMNAYGKEDEQDIPDG